MKIAKYSDAKGEAWGVVEVDEGTVRPLQGAFDEWAPAITSGGPDAAPLASKTVKLESVRLLAPLTPTTRVFGTGMNYRSHTETAGQSARAKAAPCFMVTLNAMVGPDEEMRYPDITNQFDYEIELVCVMGAEVSDPDAPLEALLGYTIGCDSSARDAGMPVGLPIDLFSMKGTDSTRPLGPWIVTRDELGGEAQPSVFMTTRINGEQRQHDTTGAMAWDIAACINWLNTRAALTTGDIIFTGTCGGTAVEDEMRSPGSGRFLQPGDALEFEIENIGVLRSTVGPKSPNHVGYPTSVADYAAAAAR
jgi:2-keto-4-pentenoate hydratase/2-oxohepta-3-ene-1,7-dioic acid hydratase in catechol pathway